jgi:hypothetical protein
MSPTGKLPFTGSLIADHRGHGWPYDDAGQSRPLLAGERIKLRRRRQTSGESALLDVDVHRAFTPVVVVVVLRVTVAVSNAFSAGLAAPSRARCAVLGLRTLTLVFCILRFGHYVSLHR